MTSTTEEMTLPKLDICLRRKIFRNQLSGRVTWGKTPKTPTKVGGREYHLHINKSEFPSVRN